MSVPPFSTKRYDGEQWCCMWQLKNADKSVAQEKGFIFFFVCFWMLHILTIAAFLLKFLIAETFSPIFAYRLQHSLGSCSTELVPNTKRPIFRLFVVLAEKHLRPKGSKLESCLNEVPNILMLVDVSSNTAYQ